MGLDDCLLPRHVETAAAQVFAANVQRWCEQPHHRTGDQQQAVGGEDPMPYRVDDSHDVMSRLIALRSDSERLVVRACLGERSGREDSAMARTNQISVLCMLGTKGSVSNLVAVASSILFLLP